jgi:hypothetical protein
MPVPAPSQRSRLERSQQSSSPPKSCSAPSKEPQSAHRHRVPLARNQRPFGDRSPGTLGQAGRPAERELDMIRSGRDTTTRDIHPDGSGLVIAPAAGDDLSADLHAANLPRQESCGGGASAHLARLDGSAETGTSNVGGGVGTTDPAGSVTVSTWPTRIVVVRPSVSARLMDAGELFDVTAVGQLAFAVRAVPLPADPEVDWRAVTESSRSQSPSCRSIHSPGEPHATPAASDAKSATTAYHANRRFIRLLPKADQGSIMRLHCAWSFRRPRGYPHLWMKRCVISVKTGKRIGRLCLPTTGRDWVRRSRVSPLCALCSA